MIPLFDLHCDTLLKLYKNQLLFKNNQLHINQKDTFNYSPYLQVFAIWSDSELDNESAFFQYKKTLSYANSLNFHFARKLSNTNQNTFILAVEDARLLNGKIARLDELFNDNVRILTLNWQGNSIIGGGWDTNAKLTDFGNAVVMRAFELGIIIDLSHSSYETAKQVLNLCENNKKSVIFSHSNSFSVYNHKRNVTDDLFLDVIKTSSILGLSLVTQHISGEICTIKHILNHIYHFLSLGGENSIALGCDFDGTDNLPMEISSIKDLTKLYEAIKKEFGKDISDKIFFNNAFTFFKRNL